MDCPYAEQFRQCGLVALAGQVARLTTDVDQLPSVPRVQTVASATHDLHGCPGGVATVVADDLCEGLSSLPSLEDRKTAVWRGRRLGGISVRIALQLVVLATECRAILRRWTVALHLPPNRKPLSGIGYAAPSCGASPARTSNLQT